MTADDVFYTKTMAKIYTDQGNLVKAAEIYHFLINREPNRQDLIDALAEVEAKLLEKRPNDLLPLIRKWVQLSLKYNRIKKIEKLRSKLE